MERRKKGNESLLCMDLRGGKKRLLTNEFAARRIAGFKPWKSMGGGWVFAHEIEV
jgi:hypothetical protein